MVKSITLFLFELGPLAAIGGAIRAIPGALARTAATREQLSGGARVAAQEGMKNAQMRTSLDISRDVGKYDKAINNPENQISGSPEIRRPIKNTDRENSEIVSTQRVIPSGIKQIGNINRKYQEIS